tara:strand:+ start:73 stop:534 length:462 start_codon:yes stop_codon:yes gene_type:complete
MTVKVTVEVNRKLTVNADIDTVFTLLSDVNTAVSYFPNVQELTDLGDNAFRWEMEEISSGGYTVKTIYACQYAVDSDAKTIVWTPVKGVGNGIVSGQWELTAVETGTDISFTTQAELTFPFPRLLKLVTSPIVKLEFTGMVDTYLSNLKELWT